MRTPIENGKQTKGSVLPSSLCVHERKGRDEGGRASRLHWSLSAIFSRNSICILLRSHSTSKLYARYRSLIIRKILSRIGWRDVPPLAQAPLLNHVCPPSGLAQGAPCVRMAFRLWFTSISPLPKFLNPPFRGKKTTYFGCATGLVTTTGGYYAVILN